MLLGDFLGGSRLLPLDNGVEDVFVVLVGMHHLVLLDTAAGVTKHSRVAVRGWLRVFDISRRLLLLEAVLLLLVGITIVAGCCWVLHWGDTVGPGVAIHHGRLVVLMRRH